MKKLYNNKILIGLIIIVNIIQLHSQPINNQIKDAVMPAPNVAALGKYGDIPISYFTGVPNISIPLYNVSEGPIGLPITLSYHAAGIRVAEMASWVGIGWSLNAGGAVTRTVQGLPDDAGYPIQGFFNSGQQPVSETSTSEIIREVIDGFRDPEPDLFSFNMGGYSGKFYFDFDENGELQPIIVPKQDIKIEKIGINPIESFIITTADGIKYIFGKVPGQTVTAYEYSLGFSENPSSDKVSSWYLLQIESYRSYAKLRIKLICACLYKLFLKA